MHGEGDGPTRKQTIIRGAILLAVTILAAVLMQHYAGSSSHIPQGDVLKVTLASAIFMMVIMATLLFWQFRLAIAFIGIGGLLAAKALTVSSFIHSAELPIILFLVGMMVIVGVLKELGLFTWIIELVISTSSMTGIRFIVIVVYLSALLACVVDEVTSIVFVATLIFQVCDTLKIRPTPYIMIAVLGTNVGSCGTMLGNPVGIMIGLKGGFHFQDFLIWSFPVMLMALTVTLIILCFYFRKDIALMDERLQQRRDMGLELGPLVKVPYRRGLFILMAMIALIGSHHFLEQQLGLETNTLLVVAPLVVAGFLMIWRYKRARHYIEAEVEWWTLLFFMMLFAVAGSLQQSGVTRAIALDFQAAFADVPHLLAPAVIFASAIGSAFVDNIVFVAAFIPVVDQINQTPLWWGLLFGACFGGNITMIGSTANIVALGMLEKRYRAHIYFFEWLKIGAVVGLVSCLLAWGALALLSPYMPERPQKADEHALEPLEPEPDIGVH